MANDMAGHRKSNVRDTLKMGAALVGGSALIALAAFGVAVGGDSEGTAVAKSTSMTMGATSTQTTPSNAPAIGVAKPAIKGPAPLPSEEAAAK